MQSLHRSSLLVITILLLCGCAAEKSTPTLGASRPSTTTPSLTATPLPPTPLPPTPLPPTPSHTPLPPTDTPYPTATPNRLPEGVEAVSITTDDGFDLAGYLHIPVNPVSENMAVLLAHEYYSTHHSWEWLAEKLMADGFTTLTFDSRGHGESPGPKVFETAGIDTKAAVNYLNQQGFNQVVCLGTSMGGSGCLIAAIDMEVAGIAMLSSPMDIGRLRLLSNAELESLTIPKILMITEEDRVGADFVADFIEMTEMIAEPKEIYIYPGDEHAAEMFYFESGDEVQEILFNFVTGFSRSGENQPSTKTSFIPSLTTADCTSVGLPGIACTGVSSNDDWEPVIHEFDGVPMTLVPPGCFMMGNEDSFPEMQPVHEICSDRPFWIDLTEVTVGQFADFLNGQYQPIDNYDPWLDVWGVTFDPPIQLEQDNGKWHPLYKEENRPLQSVIWVGAFDYCAWRNARLPSEAEWEYAARGPDNLLYPWGNEFKRDRIVRYEGKNPEVGSKPQGASWVGSLDMVGSLFEWTNSLYMPYPYQPFDGREASFGENKGDRVFRGSAWYHPEWWNDDLSATARFDARPDYATWYFGFRCARDFTVDDLTE